MREIRQSGSEGGAGFIPVPTPILDATGRSRLQGTDIRRRGRGFGRGGLPNQFCAGDAGVECDEFRAVAFGKREQMSVGGVAGAGDVRGKNGRAEIVGQERYAAGR